MEDLFIEDVIEDNTKLNILESLHGIIPVTSLKVNFFRIYIYP